MKNNNNKMKKNENLLRFYAFAYLSWCGHKTYIGTKLTFQLSIFYFISYCVCVGITIKKHKFTLLLCFWRYFYQVYVV